jgi:hypothetical protein
LNREDAKDAKKQFGFPLPERFPGSGKPNILAGVLCAGLSRILIPKTNRAFCIHRMPCLFCCGSRLPFVKKGLSKSCDVLEMSIQGDEFCSKF